MLSTGFLSRRNYHKVVLLEMAGLGLRPLDVRRNGIPLFPMSDVSPALELLSRADAYLAIIDTQYVMTRIRSQSEHIDSEFEQAVKAGLPIGLLVMERTKSAPTRVSASLQQTIDKFEALQKRYGSPSGSLVVRRAPLDLYQSEIRAILTTLSGSLRRGDADLPTIPDQSPAPVRVEERNGRVSRISDRDSPLSAEEQDFNQWREPVLDHIQEMLSGDFRRGTNHSRARDRLVALAQLLSGGIAEMKDRQFRIGYEIERLGGLVSAYRSGGDDMPTLSVDVLEDLDRLRIALMMGITKLERWAEFRRAAAADPMHDGEANPVALSEGLAGMAVEMDRQPTYFDPELPETFRFLAEAARDPRGATRTVVYGGVKSAENLVSFLGRKALGIGASAVGAVEQHISKAVAAALIVALSRTALAISGAVPAGWVWLQPLLEALASEDDFCRPLTHRFQAPPERSGTSRIPQRKAGIADIRPPKCRSTNFVSLLSRLARRQEKP
jgi:hypothetical protein